MACFTVSDGLRGRAAAGSQGLPAALLGDLLQRSELLGQSTLLNAFPR